MSSRTFNVTITDKKIITGAVTISNETLKEIMEGQDLTEKEAVESYVHEFNHWEDALSLAKPLETECEYFLEIGEEL